MIPGSDRDHPSLRQSFGFAIQGFRIAWRGERNLKIMFAAAVFAIVCGAVLSISPVEWALVLLGIGTVFAGELFNTAIETIVDLVSPEYHPLAGKAKDVAAAAVWVLSCLVGVMGVVIFLTRLIELLGSAR